MADPMMDMGAMAEEPSAPEAAPEATDDFAAAAGEAFPDIAGDPARLEALKTAIRLCLEEDQAGGYEGADDKKPGGLALVFGAGPKKGK